MSHVSVKPLDNQEQDLIDSLQNLAISGSNQGIAKTSTTTFENVTFSGGGGGGGTWGSITGTLSNQTDLQAALNAKGTFTLPSLTNGSVLFSNGTTLAQDNANFFWDDTNNRLGIGTMSPTGVFHIKQGAGAGVYWDAPDANNWDMYINGLYAIRASGTNLTLGYNYTNILLGHYNKVGIGAQGSAPESMLEIGKSPTADVPYFSLSTNMSSTNGDVLMVNYAGNVGIGTTTPGAQLQVNVSAAGTIGSIIKGASSQSANLTEWQNSSGTVIASITKNGSLTVTGSLAAGGTLPAIESTANIPSQTAFTTATGNLFTINTTPILTSVTSVKGVAIDLPAGYTDSAYITGLNVTNSTDGRGTALNLDSASITNGMSGIFANVTAASNASGSKVAIQGAVSSGSSNGQQIGVLGKVWGTFGSATNIGVLGNVSSLPSGGKIMGGYFGLHDATPTFESSALIADNGAIAVPIFMARDNGTAVFTIADGGAVTSTGVFLSANGSSGAPTYSFSNQTNTGFYYSGFSQIRAGIAGVPVAEFDAGGLNLATNSLEWSTGIGGTTDTYLKRTAASTVTLSSNGSSGAANIIVNGSVSAPKVFFTSEIDNGNSGTAKTITWASGNKQKVTLTDNCTFTFTAPSGVGDYTLKIVMDGVGGYTNTWPSTVKWPKGFAPAMVMFAGATEYLTFYFDGTNYLGSFGNDMVTQTAIGSPYVGATSGSAIQKANGSGGLTAATVTTDYTLLSGLTTNYVPKATAADTIGNSQVFDDGTYAGVATATPAATWDINGSMRTLCADKSANYTLTLTDSTIYATTGVGGITVTLPAASSTTIGLYYFVYKVDSGVGLLTIAAAGSDTVNGVATKTIANRWNGVLIRGLDATSWIVTSFTGL